jgi:hypothetical protein
MRFSLQGLGTSCASLYDFLVPVICVATDLSQPDSVYLLEDGLELWLTVLHNSVQMTPPLFQLASNIAPILGKKNEWNIGPVSYARKADKVRQKLA